MSGGSPFPEPQVKSKIGNQDVILILADKKNIHTDWQHFSNRLEASLKNPRILSDSFQLNYRTAFETNAVNVSPIISISQSSWLRIYCE
jgi:hypothetical protein